MSRLRLVLFAGLAVLGLLFAGGSSALAATTGNTTASVTVNNVLSLSGVTPSFSLAGDPGTLQTALAAVSFTLVSNNLTGAHVSDGSAVANFAGTGGNPDTFIGTTLKQRCAPAIAAYTAVPLGNAPATVANETVAGTLSQSCDMQVTIPSTVRPDTYSIVLTFTAISNP